jgi:hypothetical protein
VLTALKPQPGSSELDQEYKRRVDETDRCAESLSYFCNTYCQILSSEALAGDWVPFKLWPEQEGIAAELQAHKRVVGLKARQLGWTWIIVALGLQRLLFHPVATVLFFSKRDDEATELLEFRLREMYQRLPDWMRSTPLVKDATHEIEVPNGSRVKAFATTGGRSYTGTLAVIDEADYVPDLGQMLNAIKPTVDGGGQLRTTAPSFFGMMEATAPAAAHTPSPTRSPPCPVRPAGP